MTTMPTTTARTWRTAAISLGLLTSVATAAVAGRNALETLDARAVGVTHEAVIRTAAAFAVAKTLNAAISVARSFTVGTDFLVHATVAPGQALDPADRVIDELADGLLAAASVAYALELLLTAGSRSGPEVLVGAALLLALGLLLRGLWGARGVRGCAFLRAAGVGVLVLRVGLPLALAGAGWAAQGFLASPRDAALLELKTISGRALAMSTVSDTGAEQDGTIAGLLGTASDRIAGVGAALNVLRENFDTLFRSAFTLAATLALEVVLFPLLAVWSAWRLSRALAVAEWRRGST